MTRDEASVLYVAMVNHYFANRPLKSRAEIGDAILTALSAGEGPTAEQLADLARENAEMAVQLVTARRSCPHCDAVVLPDDMGDHWRRCEKHPARIALSAIDSPNVIAWSVMKQIARDALADPAPKEDRR